MRLPGLVVLLTVGEGRAKDGLEVVVVEQQLSVDVAVDVAVALGIGGGVVREEGLQAVRAVEEAAVANAEDAVALGVDGAVVLDPAGLLQRVVAGPGEQPDGVRVGAAEGGGEGDPRLVLVVQLVGTFVDGEADGLPAGGGGGQQVLFLNGDGVGVQGDAERLERRARVAAMAGVDEVVAAREIQ